MTQEESKQKLWAAGSIDTISKVECDNILNEVYDDLEKLLKKIYDDFESRTCESCKYRIFNGEFENDVCKNVNSLMSEHEVSGDFGCNKWMQQ